MARHKKEQSKSEISKNEEIVIANEDNITEVQSQDVAEIEEDVLTENQAVVTEEQSKSEIKIEYKIKRHCFVCNFGYKVGDILSEDQLLLPLRNKGMIQTFVISGNLELL